MKITPSVSLLSNSNDYILKEMVSPMGNFQIFWVPEIDSHVLFYQKPGSEPTHLAMHNNGFSCHVLAERIIKGEVGRAVSQLQYIKDCGGMGVDESVIRDIFLP